MDRPDTIPAPICNAADALLEPILQDGRGDRPALITDQATISYRELDEQARHHARALHGLGISPRQRVLLLLKDSPEFIYCYLGAMKAAAVPVALSLRLCVEDLRHVMADSEATLLICDADYLQLAEEAAAPIDPAPRILPLDAAGEAQPTLAALLEEAEPRFDSLPLDEDAAACWLYTSGTTGQPKAVVHTLRSVLAADRHLGELLNVGSDDRLFSSSKLFFAFALGHCLFTALRSGAAIILNPDWPTPESVLDSIARHRPTIVFSVPAMYRNLMQHGLGDCHALTEVRHFVAAGEKLPAMLANRWHDLTGCPILEGIGSTETLYLFLANLPGRCRPGMTGIPTPGAEVRLVDPYGDPVEEAGQPGTLWVKTDSIADSYWKQPEKSAQTFVDGWYHTGDTFTLDSEGWYQHLGRADDMLKVSGQWVSPSEIEEIVLRHPAVSDAAVVGAADSDGLIRLVLFIITRSPDQELDPLQDELIERLRARLSIYKCPRRIAVLDEMPATTTGKIMRVRLRQMAGEMLVNASG